MAPFQSCVQWSRLSTKLGSAVAAIFIGGLKCWTHFWKGTTQWSFQQSLVEIGLVVSEEKIFKKFHHPFFSILSLTDFLVGSNRNVFNCPLLL
jgi:hypothetical protein